MPDAPVTPDQPTFLGTVWSKLKAWGSLFAMKVAAPGVALLVVIGGVILVSMGAKELNIGGLLGKLLGKSSTKATTDISNTIPDNRVDPSGKIIPQGTPDAKGDTQAVVVPITNTGGLFSDPSTVTVTPPGSDTPINIQLPTGVLAKDVNQVVIVQPGQFVVTVKDSSGIPAQSIDDILKKYGG